MSALLAAVVPAAAAWATGDAERGRKEFLRCATCHAAEPNVHKSGPSLATVYGQRAGIVEGFSRYSDALEASNVVWNSENLDAWLQDPRTFIPGNRMTMRGIEDPQVRQDIVAYLAELAAENAAAAESDAGAGQTSGQPATRPDLPDLKTLGPEQQVTAIRYCGDTYHVSTASGEVWPFWEFNLRFKTDSSGKGPKQGRPVLLPASMMGDRAFVIFASPTEISSSVESTC